MDHELKQRLIGATVVTALCAIFIPMLFDDPIDTNAQLVSELNIPASDLADGSSGKPPLGAEPLSKLPASESLMTEVPGEIIESTGAEEEVAEPEKGQSKQEPLYAESEGYTQGGESRIVESPLKNRELSANQTHQKYSDAAKAKSLSAETAKSMTTKAAHVDSLAKETAKLKKSPEAIKSTAVKKPELLSQSEDDVSIEEAKQHSASKSLAAAVAEAKTPTDAPKASQKLVRWYIQVGSFSKKENAMSLWESLRDQGLPTALDTIQTDKGTTYRLRVGPELDGKKAVAMKARLDQQNIKAMLISE
jgi:DedD protein